MPDLSILVEFDSIWNYFKQFSKVVWIVFQYINLCLGSKAKQNYNADGDFDKESSS